MRIETWSVTIKVPDKESLNETEQNLHALVGCPADDLPSYYIVEIHLNEVRQ